MTSQSDGLYSGARPLKYFLIKSPPEEQFNEHFLRTKPGRMDLPLEKRSLSLSCSDKVGLWNLLGIQGKRLFNYIKPIYIDTIIIKTYHKISPKQISKGINLPYRISKLCKVAKNKIIGKLFKIVINGKIRVITNQFKHHTPNIIIINKSNQ
jgi:tRNA-specific adenosine deaminase 1